MLSYQFNLKIRIFFKSRILPMTWTSIRKRCGQGE